VASDRRRAPALQEKLDTLPGEGRAMDISAPVCLGETCSAFRSEENQEVFRPFPDSRSKKKKAVVEGRRRAEWVKGAKKEELGNKLREKGERGEGISLKA